MPIISKGTFRLSLTILVHFPNQTSWKIQNFPLGQHFHDGSIIIMKSPNKNNCLISWMFTQPQNERSKFGFCLHLEECGGPKPRKMQKKNEKKRRCVHILNSCVDYQLTDLASEKIKSKQPINISY